MEIDESVVTDNVPRVISNDVPGVSCMNAADVNVLCGGNVVENDGSQLNNMDANADTIPNEVNSNVVNGDSYASRAARMAGSASNVLQSRRCSGPCASMCVVYAVALYFGEICV